MLSISVECECENGSVECFSVSESQEKQGWELNCNLPGKFIVEHDPDFVPMPDGSVKRVSFLYYKTQTARKKLSTDFQEISQAPLPVVKARVSDMTERAEIKKPHPDEKKCSDCIKFDRITGREELMRVTHSFDGGLSGYGIQAEIQAVAELAKSASLNSENVGFCAPHKQLCADSVPACTQYFLQR